MSAVSRDAVTAAQVANLDVYVSPMTAWEIAALVFRNRLQLSLSPEAWFDAVLGLAGVRLAALPPGVLIASESLPGAPAQGPGGPHHRRYRPGVWLHGDHPRRRTRALCSSRASRIDAVLTARSKSVAQAGPGSRNR